MSHETSVSTTDEIGMVCVRPSVGKFSLESTSSYTSCIAEFDNVEEADEFSKDWSNASGSKERRRQLIDIHALQHPDYFRLSGKMLDDYIDYYFDEYHKIAKEE